MVVYADRHSSCGFRILATGVNVVVSMHAWYLVLAPKLMKLPGHHCIYCMWQYAPFTIAMTGLFILGSASSGWAAWLRLAGNGKEPSDAAAAQVRLWYLVSGVSLVLPLVLASM